MAVVGGVGWLAATAGRRARRPRSAPKERPRGATVTLFGSAAPRVRAVGARRAAELGVRFRSSRAGEIVGIRFYKTRGNSGRHTGTLWSSSGRKLARVRFKKETASGWQSARFAEPVAIKAGTTYIASYHAPRGRFARNARGLPEAQGERAADRRREPLRVRLGCAFPDPDRRPRELLRRRDATPRRRTRRSPRPAPGRRAGGSPPGGAPLPPLGQPSCVSGAVNVTTASAVASNLAERQQRLRDRRRRPSGPQRRVVDFVRRRVPGDHGQRAHHDPVRQRGRRLEHQGACRTTFGLYDARNITVEQSRLGGDGPTQSRR